MTCFHSSSPALKLRCTTASLLQACSWHVEGCSSPRSTLQQKHVHAPPCGRPTAAALMCGRAVFLTSAPLFRPHVEGFPAVAASPSATLHACRHPFLVSQLRLASPPSLQRRLPADGNFCQGCLCKPACHHHCWSPHSDHHALSRGRGRAPAGQVAARPALHAP